MPEDLERKSQLEQPGFGPGFGVENQPRMPVPGPEGAIQHPVEGETAQSQAGSKANPESAAPQPAVPEVPTATVPETGRTAEKGDKTDEVMDYLTGETTKIPDVGPDDFNGTDLGKLAEKWFRNEE